MKSAIETTDFKPTFLAMFLCAIIAMMFSSAVMAQRGGGDIIFIDCPAGMVQAGPNLCVQAIATGEKAKLYHYTDRRSTNNKTYMDAQMDCRAQGGHVCRVDEIYQAWDLIATDLDRLEMLGNYVSDDHHLCINNPRDKNNFDGTCHKHYKLRYRCCVEVSPPPFF